MVQWSGAPGGIGSIWFLLRFVDSTVPGGLGSIWFLLRFVDSTQRVRHESEQRTAVRYKAKLAQKHTGVHHTDRPFQEGVREWEGECQGDLGGCQVDLGGRQCRSWQPPRAILEAAKAILTAAKVNLDSCQGPSRQPPR